MRKEKNGKKERMKKRKKWKEKRKENGNVVVARIAELWEFISR